jgi:hypothetical protein
MEFMAAGLAREERVDGAEGDRLVAVHRFGGVATETDPDEVPEPVLVSMQTEC